MATYSHSPIIACILFKDVQVEVKQLTFLTAEVKKVNNVLSLVISWNLNDLDHAVIRIKQAATKGNVTIDWESTEVLTNIEVGSGKTTAVFQNPISGYKYLIEGIGVNEAGIESDAENTPKLEIYCDTIYDPDPVIPDGQKETITVITPRRLKYFYTKLSSIFENQNQQIEALNKKIEELNTR